MYLAPRSARGRCAALVSASTVSTSLRVGRPCAVGAPLALPPTLSYVKHESTATPLSAERFREPPPAPVPRPRRRPEPDIGPPTHNLLEA